MALRDRLIADSSAKPHLPEWIRKSRSLSQLWSFFKQWKTYEERRHVVWDGFRPLLESLEGEGTPLDDELSGLSRPFMPSTSCSVGRRRSIVVQVTLTGP